MRLGPHPADTPAGRLSWEQRTLPFPKPAGRGKAVRVGDLDGDGVPDFVLSCECGPSAHGLLAVGAGRGFVGEHRFVRTIAGPAGPKGYKPDRVELLDLDGDGDLDVLTTEERNGLGVVWYENGTR